MKLIFKKDENGNVLIELVTGTTTVDFSYVAMIKSLLVKNEVEEPEFDISISDDEQERIKAMLDKISAAITEEPESQ